MLTRWLRGLLAPMIEAEVGKRMAATENELWERIAARTGTVMAENESLKTGIAQKDQALADASALIENLKTQLDGEGTRQAEAVKSAVDEALAVDSQADAERLAEHLKALGGDLPTEVEVPQVETPEPGAPAEPPADSGVEVPGVEPSAPVEPSPEVSEPIEQEPVSDTTPAETPNVEGEQSQA